MNLLALGVTSFFYINEVTQIQTRQEHVRPRYDKKCKLCSMSTSPQPKKAMSNGTNILFRNNRSESRLQKAPHKNTIEGLRFPREEKNGNSSKRLFKSQNHSSSQFFVAQLPFLVIFSPSPKYLSPFYIIFVHFTFQVPDSYPCQNSTDLQSFFVIFSSP